MSTKRLVSLTNPLKNLMPLINDENYKGVSLEEFVEFQIEELDLIEELVSCSKKKEVFNPEGKYHLLDLIQAKLLILNHLHI
tara:strand:- start:1063 stop:1308 length:246 start_codon:yes stop_codon:yes gene_type:complete